MSKKVKSVPIKKTKIKYEGREALEMTRRKIGKFAIDFVTFFLIAGLCFTILYPVLALVPVVLSAIEDLGNPNVIWIPEKFSTISFQAAAKYIIPGGLLSVGKSVGYAALIMVIQVISSAMVGYSIARVKSKWSTFVLFLVILVFLVPRQSLLLAQYIFIRNFDIFGILKATGIGEIDLLNQPIALFTMALLGFGVNQSLFIFIFSQFFKNIPKELEEAALLDGCGFVGTYVRVMIPNAVPVISTISILSFVWNFGDTYYRNYFYPNGGLMSTLLSTSFVEANKQTVMSAIQTWYNVSVMNDLGFDAIKQAACLIFLVPLLIVFLIGQGKLVENLESSGLVG